MTWECTCDTMLKNGVLFRCFTDPECPEHGEKPPVTKMKETPFSKGVKKLVEQRDKNIFFPTDSRTD